MQDCGTADPCIRKVRCSMILLQIPILSYMNFDCKTFKIKTKHCNYNAKTKHNLASKKNRKWVIVILHLPLQRYLTVIAKTLNWSITMILQKIKFCMRLMIMPNDKNRGDWLKEGIAKKILALKAKTRDEIYLY